MSFEVLIGNMGKDRDTDTVLRKCAALLGQAERCEPSPLFPDRRPYPASFGLVDLPDGRLYPIDRSARNRPQTAAAGVTGASPP